MEKTRKIKLEIPPELRDKARRASGTVYSKLRGFRGKVRFSRTSAELKVDR
jgi:hypothetical protein